jgi:hypothetical protein
MIYPSPDNSANAPVWENYVVAQAVQAMLGVIPAHALAIGVKVDENNVWLHFQLSELDAEDQDDIDDAVVELGSLMGSDVEVSSSYEVTSERKISPQEGTRWIFVARS